MPYTYIVIIILILIFLVYYILKGGKSEIGNGTFLSSSSVLSKYSRDLAQLARDKKLDPVIGREKEIARAIQILSRRTKNNPLLIGKAGVGKTSIAEGLALSVVDRKVPSVLYGKRVLALDLSGILAGTKYRGEFEQRLKKITDEIISAKRMIVLFIDGIHILAEAGEAEGAINAADILKPLLARGELQVAGATTKDEYDKYIKQDKTLDRRLQPVYVAEPTISQTKEILRGIKKIYEDYHKVTITSSAIDESVDATKTITSRSYPDKAIDALDEACSKVRIDHILKAKKGKDGNLTVDKKDIKMVVAQWKNNF